MRDRIRSGLDRLVRRFDVRPSAVELHLDEQFDVSLGGEVPIKVRADQKVSVRLDDDVPANVEVDQVLEVPIDEEIEVPVSFVLEVPLDTRVRVHDVLEVSTTMHLDTVVKAAGIAPIPIEADIPVYLKVPIDQQVHIQGQLQVPVDHVVRFRLVRTLKVPLQGTLPVKVHMDHDVPVVLDVDLDTKVRVAQKVPVHLKQTLVLTGDNVRFRDRR